MPDIYIYIYGSVILHPRCRMRFYTQPNSPLSNQPTNYPTSPNPGKPTISSPANKTNAIASREPCRARREASASRRSALGYPGSGAACTGSDDGARPGQGAPAWPCEKRRRHVTRSARRGAEAAAATGSCCAALRSGGGGGTTTRACAERERRDRRKRTAERSTWSDGLRGIGRKRALGSQGDDAHSTHGCGAEPEHAHARNMAGARPIYLILL